MKRFLPLFLLVLSLLGGKKEAKAQAHLVIQSLYNLPDTVNYNASVFPIIVVGNIGTAPYFGSNQVMILGEDSTASPQFLYNNSTPDTLFPQDTISLTPGGNGFQINVASGFRMGNNVVVVWPHTVQSNVLVDTLYTNIYVRQAVGLAEKPGIKGLQYYPNPSNGFVDIYAAGYKLESVRIMDLTGRVIDNISVNGNDKARISLEKLPRGVYLFEVSTDKKEISVVKVIRAEE